MWKGEFSMLASTALKTKKISWIGFFQKLSLCVLNACVWKRNVEIFQEHLLMV